MSIMASAIANLVIKLLIIKFSFYVIIFNFVMSQNKAKLIKIKLNTFIQTFQPSFPWQAVK
jgi:uncharacterized protein YggT (Ycf19 family)